MALPGYRFGLTSSGYYGTRSSPYGMHSYQFGGMDLPSISAGMGFGGRHGGSPGGVNVPGAGSSGQVRNAGGIYGLRSTSVHALYSAQQPGGLDTSRRQWPIPPMPRKEDLLRRKPKKAAAESEGQETDGAQPGPTGTAVPTGATDGGPMQAHGYPLGNVRTMSRDQSVGDLGTGGRGELGTGIPENYRIRPAIGSQTTIGSQAAIGPGSIRNAIDTTATEVPALARPVPSTRPVRGRRSSFYPGQ